MRILVTGGAGFIGSHTADALIRDGHEVTILDNLAEPVHRDGQALYISPGARFIHGDVRNRDAWTKALAGIEAVLHFAAHQDFLPDFSQFFDTNTTGTALLYEVIVSQRLPIQKVLIASSQAVYGEGPYLASEGHTVYPDLRLREQLEQGQWDLMLEGEPIIPQSADETQVNPQNHYALSKYTQELVSLRLGRSYSIPTVCLRYSIVQGPRQSFYNAYSGACRIFSMANHLRRPVPIYEDGKQLRDFVNIEDVVSANLLALYSSQTAGNIYNVGGGKAYTILELASMAAEIYDTAIPPVIGGQFRLGDTRHISSDITKLRNLGWRPTRDPRYSLSSYRAWLTEQTIPSDILDKAYKILLVTQVIGQAKRNQA